MAYEFIEREADPEPQAAGSRSGGPPLKPSALGVLDPPFPPKKPLRPIPPVSRSGIFRVFVALILVGLAFYGLAVLLKIL